MDISIIILIIVLIAALAYLSFSIRHSDGVVHHDPEGIPFIPVVSKPTPAPSAPSKQKKKRKYTKRKKK
tara:strand:- start:45 stop:251 length:207 start_codon:yes stop_codon:yes gene_type:complete